MTTRWLSRLITVALLGGLAVGATWLVATQVSRRQAGEAFHTWGQFRDASRLPVGSRIMIAGVHVGEIDGLAIDGRLARVSMRLRDGTELWDDAWAEKRVASAFGDGYVEIHPGGAGPGRRRLVSGEPLGHVFEGVSIDRTLRELDQALPRAQGAIRDAQVLMVETRRVIGGSVAAELAALDAAIQRGGLAETLHGADDAMTQLETWTTDAADRSSGYAGRLDGTLTSIDDGLIRASGQLRHGQAAVVEAMTTARVRIDEVDPDVEEIEAVIAELAGKGPREDRGRLATLIQDPDLGDTIADVTERGREFVRSTSRLRTSVGLRTELNMLSRQPRFYVSAELAAHRDSFYLVEAQKSAHGDTPEVTLTEQPGGPGFLRTASIFEGIRFTAQYGKRLGWIDVRFGLKESTFGVGADSILLGGRLRLSTDLYGPSFSRVPRLKLAAAFEVFQWVYLLGGVDDALHAGGYLPISPWPAGQDVPTQFDELRYGRDVFLGFELRFHDADLNTLLAIYGATIIGAL